MRVVSGTMSCSRLDAGECQDGRYAERDRDHQPFWASLTDSSVVPVCWCMFNCVSTCERLILGASAQIGGSAAIGMGFLLLLGLRRMMIRLKDPMVNTANHEEIDRATR